MNIRIVPTGIDPDHIPLFRKISTLALKRELTEAELGILLVRVGGMDAWPQLQELGEMDAIMRAPGFVAGENEELVMSFLHLGVTVQDKIMLAWIESQEKRAK